MVENTPEYHVHELFTQGFWEDHPLGRPILGTKETVESFNADLLRKYFKSAYTANNLIVSAVGNLEHESVRDLVLEKFGSLTEPSEIVRDEAPRVVPKILVRNKELEQSHVCLGVGSYPQNHDDRYSSYVLNTLLGGSMSSRLFQNVREKRGLAYAVFSGLSAYRDAGSFTIYAGCSNEAVGEVIDLVVEELRGVKQTLVPDAELQRAKDHLKGSLMLSLENTATSIATRPGCSSRLRPLKRWRRPASCRRRRRATSANAALSTSRASSRSKRRRSTTSSRSRRLWPSTSVPPRAGFISA